MNQSSIGLRSGSGAVAAVVLLLGLTGELPLSAVQNVAAADGDGKPLQATAGHVFQTGGRMDSFAFDRDGKLLVTAGWMGADDDQNAWKAGTYPGDLHLFDVADGKEIVHFEEECGALFDVAFSPDGESLATAGRVLGSPNQGEVRIWSIALRKTLITIRGQNGWSLAISYSPDGMFLATGGFDRMVHVWDARTGKELKALAHPSTPSSLSFSADGKTLVAGCRGGTVLLWDVPTWKERSVVEDNKTFLLGVALSPDGRLLATGGAERDADAGGRQTGIVRTWDLETGKERRTWRVDGLVSSVALSPDGRFIAAPHNGASLWNVENGDEVIAVPRGGSSSGDRIRFSPDRKTLAIGAFRRVQLFDVTALWEERKPPD